MSTQLSRSDGGDLVESFERRAREQPDAVAFVFVDADGREIRRDTFAGLARRARAVAGALADQQLRGERVLLLVADSSDFVPAFLGCLYLGAMAVPLKVPTRPQTLLRLAAIVRDCSPAAAIVDQATEQLLESVGVAEGFGPRRIRVDALASSGDWSPRPLGAKALALLQYTSGSTGDPRGVMLSHGNLLANLETIRVGFAVPPGATVVSWLPLFHDMGLIGNVLGSIYFGTRCVLLPAAAFSQRPMIWLEAIARFGASISGGPDFAYDLCARAATDEELAALDLSCWRVAFTGAEPVRAATLQTFAGRFERCGFDRKAFYPTYGLAEATLFVTGGSSGSGAEELRVEREALSQNRIVVVKTGRGSRAGEAEDQSRAVALVSCGHPRAGTEIRIVDPDRGEEVGEGSVGEIWVRSGSVAAGYWQRAEATRAVFGAGLAGHPEGTFLRTGDLGFVINGRLYITGRLKDLIIVGGRNHHAPDIEQIVSDAHPMLRGQRAAALGLEREGREVLVVVHEVGRADWRKVEDPNEGDLREEIMARAEEDILQAAELALAELVLVPVGRIPRTTSGKVRRQEVKQRLLAGDLTPAQRISASAPAPGAGPTLMSAGATANREDVRASVEGRILDEVASATGAARAGLRADQPFAAQGLDSLQATRVVGRLGRALGQSVSLTALYQYRTARALAEAIVDGRLTSAPPSLALSATPLTGQPRGPRPPLTHAQERLWFLNELPGASSTYNLSAVVDLGGELDVPALRWAFGQILKRHEVLRSRIGDEDGSPYLVVDDWAPMEIPIEDVLEPDHRSDGTVEDRVRAEVERPFSLDRDHPLRVRLLRLGAGRHHLVVTLHHSAADGWSVGLLVRELTYFYGGRVRGEDPQLPSLGVQYGDYAAWQRTAIEGRLLEEQLRYWLTQLEGAPRLLPLPTDRPRPAVQGFRGDVEVVTYTPDLVGGLERLATTHDASLFMVLLAGLAVLLRRHSGQEQIVIGTAIANRPRPEVEALVGLFANTLALRARLAGDLPFDELIRQVRASCLEAYTHQDLPFDLLVDRLIGAGERTLAASPVFQVLLTLQNEDVLAGLDLHGLEVFGARKLITGAKFDLALACEKTGQGLRVQFEYDCDLYDRETIVCWSRELETILGAVAAEPTRSVDSLAPRRSDHAPAWSPPGHHHLDRVPGPGGAEGLAVGEPATEAPGIGGEPAGELEQTLCQIYCEVLGLDRLEVTDNVFAAGASSLLLMRVLSRLRARGIDVSLVELFQRPTVRLLAGLLQGREPQRSDGQIARLEPGRRRPLSHAQERMWFMSQLPGLDVAYNLAASLEFEGPLDAEALAWAFRQIIERHTVLRSRVETEGGVPHLVVDRSDRQELTRQDLSGLDGETQRAEVERLAAACAGAPFVLKSEWPLRLRLLRLAEHRHVLLIAMHHMAVDAGSMALLAHELAHFYRGRRKGPLQPLPALALQYSDYAAWQRAELQRGSYLAGIRYWVAKLQDRPRRLLLPTDHDPRSSKRNRGGVETIEYPTALLEGLQALARRNDASLFMVLLAGFLGLLRRYTGEGDLVVGCPITSRPRIELEALVGLFVNTLLLRTNLDDDPAFDVLVGRVRQTCLEAFRHQDVPFDVVAERLTAVWAEPSSARDLFQVLFAFQGRDTFRAIELEGLRLRDVKRHYVGSKCDLALSLEETPGGLRAHFEYDRELFEPETIRRWARHYGTLLESAVADPGRPIADLAIIPENERRRLAAFSASPPPPASNQPVHALIAQQAKANYLKVAVRLGEQTLSYRELNRRADQLAALLSFYGVRPGLLVALGLERSLELVVSVLAVMKVGAACVPLDVEQPPELTVAILREAQSTVALVSPRFRPLVPPQVRAVVVAQLDRLSENTPAPSTFSDGAEQPAYVVFEPGGDGRPEGAMFVHSALVNQLARLRQLLGLEESGRVLGRTSLGSAAGLLELLLPLTAGAELVLCPPGAEDDPHQLWELIGAGAVTDMSLTPALLDDLIRAAPATGVASRLRTVLCEGEGLTPDLVGRHFRVIGARLVRIYGSAGVGHDATAWECSEADAARDRVPIGRPLGNSRVQLLDRGGRSVPIGIVGELYIGGADVVRAYHRRPELTTARLVPDPVSPESWPLHRTGELARHRDDGALELVGERSARTVQIERWLRQHPRVKACAVIEGRRGSDDVVVAHVAADPAVLPEEDLRQHLAARGLSAEPLLFSIVSELPLSAVLQIDRPALTRRPLGPATPGTSRVIVAPEGALELQVTAAYRELLDIADLGVTENVFALGAHSMLLVRLAARLRAVAGVEVPVQEFFHRPTVRQMSAYIAREQTMSGQPPERGPVRPGPPARSRGRTVELAVGSPPWRLGATFTRPRSKGPFPVVVLIPGSGPVDRDATAGPVKLFRDLAEGLLEHGIATLRYDKRTFAYRVVPQGGHITLEEEMLADARAAVARVRQRDDVREIFIAGHSFGGWLTPEIARSAAPVAGCILLAPPGRPLPQVLMDQIRQAGVLTPDQIAEHEQRVQELVEGRADPEGSFLDLPNRYYAEAMRLEPITVSRQLGVPHLLLRGDRDRMVTARDYDLWSEGLAGRPGFSAGVLRGLTHFFTHAEGPPAQVAAAAIDRIASFVISALAVRGVG